MLFGKAKRIGDKMEEFRSTDVLDKEIAADARKKAERILQRADANGKSLLDAVAGRVEEARKEMEAGLAARVAAYKKNAEAAIPLEKERFRVSFTQKTISDAMEAFIKDCGDDKLLTFVIGRYNKVKDTLGGEALSATVVGFDENKTKAALEKAGAKIWECKHTDAAALMDSGVILVGRDVKVTLTLAQILGDVEDVKRAQLAAALLKNIGGHE